jgi:hypothetical protein
MRNVSILASFCVWTKSLKCKNVVNRDSTIQSLQVRRIQVPCQPSGRSSHPVRTHICPLFHPSRQRVIPSGRQIDQASSVRTTCLSVRTLHCVEKVLSSLHPSGRFNSMSGRLSILYQFLISFQVPRKGRSINRPDDVVSRPDARLLKARIAIQISLSGRLTALVWTRVHQRRKLPIRLQRPDNCLSWSGRTNCRYGNCVLKNSRPNAHPPWSGRAKPYKEITCSGYATIRKMCHTVRTRLLNRKDFPAKFLENLVSQLTVRMAHEHHPDGAQVYFA